MKRIFFGRVHARAVGAGVARSIRAAAGKAESPEGWVHFCLTAADEAHAAVVSNPPFDSSEQEVNSARDALRAFDIARGRVREDEPPPRLSGAALADAAHAAAAMAFRVCMPKLVGRRSTQAYIACVAAGVQRGYFSGADGKALLYTAQLALAAYPARKGKRK